MTSWEHMIFIYPVTHSSLEIVQKYNSVCPCKKPACGGLCIYWVLAMALKSSNGFSLIGPKISILFFLYPNKAYFPNNRFFPSDEISPCSQFWTSKFCMSATMLLMTVGNGKVQLWGRLQGHNVDWSVNEKLSSDSKAATEGHIHTTVMSLNYSFPIWKQK